MFNRWLKFNEIELLNPTAGFVQIIKRKAYLYPDFNNALVEDGFIRVIYVNNQRITLKMNGYRNVFRRWKMVTQEFIVFRLMEEKVSQLFRLKLLTRCFWAIKTGLPSHTNIKLIAKNKWNFPILRLKSDLDQIKKRFIILMNEGLTKIIRTYNRQFLEKTKIQARKSLSFRNFLNSFNSEVRYRINTESRILSEIFEMRGIQNYIDTITPAPNHPAIPQVMSKLPGIRFCDPYIGSLRRPPEENVRILGGFKLSKIKFCMHENSGSIVGWQLVWKADTCRDVEAPKRGTWTGSGLVTRQLTVPSDDFATGLDYYYDGVTIVGVRLRLFFRGYTAYVGGKNSFSTLSVSLSADMAERAPFEDYRDKCLGPNEVENPGYPNSYVIGISGVLNNQKVTSINLIVRKIEKQTLFSYFWVTDAVEKQRLKDEEEDRLEKEAEQKAKLAKARGRRRLLRQKKKIDDDDLSVGSNVSNISNHVAEIVEKGI